MVVRFRVRYATHTLPDLHSKNRILAENSFTLKMVLAIHSRHCSRIKNLERTQGENSPKNTYQLYAKKPIISRFLVRYLPK